MRGTHVVAGGLVVAVSVVWAGRPLTVDDADPVQSGQGEIEFGAAYEHDEHERYSETAATFTLGVGGSIEIGTSVGGVMARTRDPDADGEWRREESFGDVTIGAKGFVLSRDPLGVRHALAGSVKLPTADERKGLGSGETDADVTWIASRSLGDRAGVHWNVGYTLVGGQDPDVVHCGLALDVQTGNAWQTVAEVFAENPLESDTGSSVLTRVGLRWEARDDLILDAAVGSRLSGEGPDWTATVGLTWALGLTRQD